MEHSCGLAVLHSRPKFYLGGGSKFLHPVINYKVKVLNVANLILEFKIGQY